MIRRVRWVRPQNGLDKFKILLKKGFQALFCVWKPFLPLDTLKDSVYTETVLTQIVQFVRVWGYMGLTNISERGTFYVSSGCDVTDTGL